MQRAIPFAFLVVIISVLAACGQAPSSPLAPSASAIGAGAAHLETNGEVRWGAQASNSRLSASVSSGFPCALGPFGRTDESHAVTSASGNEKLVCTGFAAVPAPEEATILTDFPCVLPSGTVTTDSRLVFTPSGHITLTCQAR